MPIHCKSEQEAMHSWWLI